MSDMDKWKESYKIGLPIRKKLTDYTPNKLKELLYSFGNIAQQICNKDFDEDRGSENLHLFMVVKKIMGKIYLQ